MCKCSGYGIGSDRRVEFLVGNGVGRNIITFGVGMSLSPYLDSKKKYILILGHGPTKGLEHTVTAEKMYSIDFTKKKKKNFFFKLSL